MFQMQFRPIVNWPGKATPARDRINGPFKATHESTLQILDRELRALGADRVVLEADAAPRSAGIILSFSSKHGPLRLPCDHFRNWQHNLRAIAMHLEHLRLSGLYGVGQLGEQYRGWKALTAPPMGLQEAAEVLVKHGGGISVTWEDVLEERGTFDAVYRRAVKIFHPDANGGQINPGWHALQQAADIIENAFRAKGK